MKTNTKGFILPLVLVIVGLVVVGGGVYYSLHETPLVDEISTDTHSDVHTGTTTNENTNTDENEPEDTPAPTFSLKTYTNTTHGFEVQYPEELTVSEVSSSAVLGAGTSFVFPSSYTQNTNLVQGRVHIETKPLNGTCSPNLFIENGGKESKVLPSILKNDLVFTGTSSAGAAAGSTYTQSVYSTAAKGKCYGIILYTQVGNLGAYGPGVKQYDAAKVEAVFQGMISTFNVL